MEKMTCMVSLFFLLTGDKLADHNPMPVTQVTQDWGGSALHDWANASQATVLTDMTQGAPASAFSQQLRSGHWKVISYAMRDTPPGTAPTGSGTGYSGKMIWAGPDTKAPKITLSLQQEGWYAIFVGVYTGCSAWVKLNTDVAPVMRSNGIRDYYANSQELFFKAAKLDRNSRLEISQQIEGYTQASGVTHVKLVPLTSEEIERVTMERSDPSHRTMAFSCDGFSFIYHRSPRTAEDLLAELEPFRYTDFGTLLLHSTWGGDKVAYPSEIGHMPGVGFDAFTEIGHRHFVDAVSELARKGINPIKTLIDGAHGMGIKVHVGLRPAGWSFLEPYADFWQTPFFNDHPQWRCVDADGTPVARMSWAVPEVRRHAIALLQEQVGLGGDGVHLVFNRGFPVVLYEAPFCKLFHEKFGFDPKTIDESDPRIIGMRSDIIVSFFKELRQMLDGEEAVRQHGERLLVSASVLGTNEDNIQYGLDIRRLVDEGLLDEIYIYPYDFGATKKGGFDLGFFREVCGPKRIPFHPALATHWAIDQQIAQGLSFVEEGASGIYIWDAWDQETDRWHSIYSRFGHFDEIRLRQGKLDFSKPPRTMYYFHKLGDKIYDGRFPVVWGG